ncbi:MAG: calcineurin-like phosphoesterase C-terminal domain-containing protein [Opitutales bacterium]
MRSGHFALFTPLVLACLAFAQETATGFVYHDANGDGSRNSEEAGVPDVLVSNGSEVVRTDAQGRYELPVTDDTALFVIKPAGWMVPLNEVNLPQFYYLHKPEGSPELEYAGVEPTGPLPDSVDFALLRKEDEDTFRMLLIGDPQPYNQQQVDYFIEDIVEDAMQIEDIAFGMTLGDIVGDDLTLFSPLNRGIARLGVPWWNVYGNHDMNFDAPTDELADETYERVFGPATYAFQWGEVWFIVLDNVIYPTPPELKRKYVGGVTEQQFAFLENLLAEIPTDDLVVFAQHIPLFVEEAFGETYRLEDRERLLSLFENHPRTLSVSGHTHYVRQEEFDAEDGWPHPQPHVHLHYNAGAGAGSWWSGPPNEHGIPMTTMRDGTPNGYSILEFDGTDWMPFWKSAGKSIEKQMHLFVPEVVPGSAGYPQEFFVNFYLGKEGDAVRYRIGDGDWREARFRVRPDPAYMQLWLEHNYNEGLPDGPPLPAPEPSHHLWSARLPGGLEPGKHTLTVEATDSWGRTFTETAEFRVK